MADAEEALVFPALILAADHRARGVPTVENYGAYTAAITAALPYVDGILASAQPLRDLRSHGALSQAHRTYLSLNRTGLDQSAFELDDRLVASVERARAEGWTGIKHMTRLDLDDPLTAPALELLGRVLEEASAAGLEALIECVGWRDGRMACDTDSIVHAAIIGHDLGAPLLKVPIPDEASGTARSDAVARIMVSVGCPVLFLGGPVGEDVDGVLTQAADVMAGGGSGLALGRAIIQHPDPAGMAARVADLVRSQ
jgi:DhnA family fructose-bisphosphate aldolase class Ia